MTDIDQELAEYGLTREEYENCLSDIRDKVNGYNDLEWEEIVKRYNLDLHYDTLRKASRTIFGGAFVTQYFHEKHFGDENASESYLTVLQREKEEIRKERMKLSTEKAQYNQLLREEARDELICEKIVGAVNQLPKFEFPEPIACAPANVREGILAFGDEHYGTEFCIKGLFGEVINEYSPEIFEQRMDELRRKTIEIVQKENISDLHVYEMGDFCDGILRVSQLMKLRYGVVEATVRYARYLATWLNELSKYVRVHFQMVFGNHTELRMLGQPKGTFKDDNTGLFVREIIMTSLEGNPNFTMDVNPTGLIFDGVCGVTVLGIHGEVKDMEKAIKDFQMIYNTRINLLLGAHKHHHKAETVGIDADYENVPSIIGIDDYSMDLARTSRPGAKLLIVSDAYGIENEYRIRL